MINKIPNDKKSDPFAIIRKMPQKSLFAEQPIKPPQKTIDAAEEFYLKFAESPSYISAYDEQIIFEWHWPTIKNPTIVRELVFKDHKNLEWRTYDY